MKMYSNKAAAMTMVAGLAAVPLLVAGCQPQAEVKTGTASPAGHHDALVAAEIARRDPLDAVPSNRPAAATGEKAWAKADCAACHGEYGNGDGPKAAALGKKLPDFTSFDFTRDKTPLSLYIAISGNDAPHPYGDPVDTKRFLSDQERWDAVFHIWQMHSTYDTLKRGGTLFVVNCSVCHGTKGYGNGQLAHTLNPKPRNFTVFEWMMDKPDNRFYRGIQHGRKWTAMPAWAALPGGKGLTREEIYEIVDYLRTYNYVYPRDIIVERGEGAH